MVAMVTVGVQPGKSSDLEELGSPWPRFGLSSRHSRGTLTEYFHRTTNLFDRSSKKFTVSQSSWLVGQQVRSSFRFPFAKNQILLFDPKMEKIKNASFRFYINIQLPYNFFIFSIIIDNRSFIQIIRITRAFIPSLS